MRMNATSTHAKSGRQNVKHGERLASKLASDLSYSGSMSELALAAPPAKFADPDWTAKGEPRARVRLEALRTLWIKIGRAHV